MCRVSLEKNLRKEIYIQVYDSEISQEKLLGRAVYSKTENDTIKLKSFDGSFTFQSLMQTTEKSKENILEKISLALTIAKAKDLEKSDYIGKSDPYIVATYGDKVFKSKTINNDQNPNWNFKIILELEEPLDNEDIIVEIYDEDYDEDDRIGEKVFKIHDLLSCDKIEDQWVELDNCKSGEIMFSTKVTRREIRESLKIETSTTEELIPRKSLSISETSQEFDKLHKKSFQMIVRKTDAEGNIVEEIFDENKNPSGGELSEINISSGIELISSVEADDYLNPTMHKSSISEFRIPKLSQENLHFGESPKTTTVTSSVTIENIEFVSDDENDENLIKSIKGLQESTKTKMQSLMETVKETKTVETSNFLKRKVVKSIDQDGNVLEEVIYEGRPKSIVETLDSPTDDLSPGLMTSIQLEYPHLTVQPGVATSTSHSSVQYFTSTSQPFETIDSFRAHFVESFADRPENKTTESISHRQGRSLFMMASADPSIDDLNTGSNFTSMMDPTLCNSCIREPSQTESSYMTNSDSFMTSNTLDDVMGFSESSNQDFKVSKTFTQTTVDSTPIISSVSISHSLSDPQERSSDLILSEGNSASYQGTCFT